MGSKVLGKRVAFLRKVENNGFVMRLGGAFQQYIVTDPMTGALPLPDDISYEKGSMHFVNPLTAISLCKTSAF